MPVSNFPAAIAAIIQNGLLQRTFEEALIPRFLFRALCTVREVTANIGERITFTRTGLLVPVETPLTPGNDPAAQEYTIEQYELSLSQYGNAMDTNMVASAVALASKYLENNQKLAINAGQSLNRLTRNKLYAAYVGGNTRAVGAGTAVTALVVDDVTGFTTVLVNGVQTAVSVSNPLGISIGGGSVVNVTAVNTGTKTLTLASAQTWSDGASVVATNAPAILRPNGRATKMAVTATDKATLGLFLDGVARLRRNNVPTFGGYYAAHIDSDTERQLFADADFREAYRGKGDSPVWQDLSIGRFAGIDWIRNTETPTTTGTSGLTVRRPMVCGADCCIEGPFANMGKLLSETSVAQGVIQMSRGVAFIQRPPLDRLQQVISSAWSWVGDYAVPTDATTGEAAQYKRCVVLEHA